MLTRIKNTLTSPLNLSITDNLGPSSGIGGLLLAGLTFGWKIKDKASRNLSLFVPLISFVTLSTLNYIHQRFIRALKKEIATDKKKINSAIAALQKSELDKYFQQNFSDSYTAITAKFEQLDMTLTVTQIEQMNAKELIEKYEQSDCGEFFALIGINIVNALRNDLSGISAILLNFVMAVILEDLQGNEMEQVGKIGLGIGLVYGTYAAVTALSVSQNEWLHIKEQKLEVINLAKQYQTLYARCINASSTSEPAFFPTNNLVV